MKVQQLAAKRRKQTKEKAYVEAEQATKEQAKQEECDSDKSQKSPLPQMEEDEQSEQGREDLESTPFHVKRHRGQENEGQRKKTKASKLSLDPITLKESDLYDIGDKVVLGRQFVIIIITL